MKDETEKHYDLLADEGNDPVLDPPALREYMDKWDGKLFLGLIDPDPAKSVLEIGCGTGRLAVKVAPFVRTFCGIDFSQKTIDIAEKHLRCPNVTLICADFLGFTFDKTFDTVYSSLTFLHIKDKEKAVKKVYSLLNPGGRFVLSVDKNQQDILDFGTRTLKIYPDDPENIMFLLEKYGFSDIMRYETEFAHIFSAQKPGER